MKTEIYQEKAVLVGLITQHQNEERAREYLDELAFLADTAGASPDKWVQWCRVSRHRSHRGFHLQLPSPPHLLRSQIWAVHRP